MNQAFAIPIASLKLSNSQSLNRPEVSSGTERPAQSRRRLQFTAGSSTQMHYLQQNDSAVRTDASDHDCVQHSQEPAPWDQPIKQSLSRTAATGRNSQRVAIWHRHRGIISGTFATHDLGCCRMCCKPPCEVCSFHVSNFFRLVA